MNILNKIKYYVILYTFGKDYFNPRFYGDMRHKIGLGRFN